MATEPDSRYRDGELLPTAKMLPFPSNRLALHYETSDILYDEDVRSTDKIGRMEKGFRYASRRLQEAGDGRLNVARRPLKREEVSGRTPRNLRDEGMTKNIVICSDGTGNTAIKNRGTNVFKLFEAIDLNGHRTNPQLVTQIAFYD